MILLMLDSVLKTMGWMLLMSVLSHTILAMLASFTAASCAGVSLVRGSSPFSYQNLDNQSPLGGACSQLSLSYSPPVPLLESDELVSDDALEDWTHERVLVRRLHDPRHEQVDVVHVLVPVYSECTVYSTVVYSARTAAAASPRRCCRGSRRG